MQVVPLARQIDPLKKAVAALDREAVRRACEAIVAGVREDPAGLDTGQACEVLRVLRGQRHFGRMEEVARAFLGAGLNPPQVRRQLCQSLIDQGKTLAAVAELNKLSADAPAGSVEGDEAEGLLGRAYKQLYMDGRRAGISAADLAPLLARACGRYHAVYKATGQIWHGINTVACLRRAKRDRAPLDGFPNLDENDLAAAILKAIEALGDAADAWSCATAAEACVALGRPAGALAWAKRYTAAPDVDAFNLSSTVRQLTEVWGLGAPKAAAKFNPVVSHLLEALVPLDPGYHDLTVDTGCKEVHSVMGGGFEKTFSDGALVAIKWFRDAINRCLGVGRVDNAAGTAWGTGFLIRKQDLLGEGSGDGDGFLFVTNAHVVSNDPNVIQARKALRPGDGPSVTFEERGSGGAGALGVSKLLWTSPPEALDYTVLELDAPVSCVPPLPLAPDLPECDGKAAAWVLGHPKGGKLSVSMKNNLLIGVRDPRLHYRSATEPGSSGSPVFNDVWQLIGLHHKGGLLPKLDPPGSREKYEANEGISIGAIVADIAAKRARPS